MAQTVLESNPAVERSRPVNSPLIGRDLDELTALLVSIGEPRYRAKQVYLGLYRDRCAGPEGITPLPQHVREVLVRDHGGGLPEIDAQFASADGTVRYLLRLGDSRLVESVFIPDAARDTLCISTQVGCPVDCKFCLTALMGLERNLTAGEIAGQVLTLSREQGLDSRRRPLNVVMMGMGEPLLNLGAVMKATRLLADPEGIAIPQRRITVSTAGIVPKIREYGEHAVRGKLAISLNASNAEQRTELMPITARYGLEELLEACRRYPLRPWERLTFEYVLLRGVNDSDRDARSVLGMLAPLRCSVNLIALNPGPGIPYETPDAGRVEAFRAIVRRGIPCFVRRPRGRDIFAACGQLKRTVEHSSEAAGETLPDAAPAPPPH